MNRSPARIVELCVYVLIIIVAVAWMITRGGPYKRPPPDAPSAVTSETAEEPEQPQIIVPRGEVFPPSAESDGGIFMPEGDD
jgi:hypothetical protein